MVEVVIMLDAAVVMGADAAFVVVVDVVVGAGAVVNPTTRSSLLPDWVDGRCLESARGGVGRVSLGASLLGRVEEGSLLPSLPNSSLEGDLILLLVLSPEGELVRRVGVGLYAGGGGAKGSR